MIKVTPVGHQAKNFQFVSQRELLIGVRAVLQFGFDFVNLLPGPYSRRALKLKCSSSAFGLYILLDKTRKINVTEFYDARQ